MRAKSMATFQQAHIPPPPPMKSTKRRFDCFLIVSLIFSPRHILQLYVIVLLVALSTT